MKIELLNRDGEAMRIAAPKKDECAVLVTEPATCPYCATAPFMVRGSRQEIGGHDYYRADAGCIKCKAYVGELRVYLSTLFGLEEDERVMRMGVRVY